MINSMEEEFAKINWSVSHRVILEDCQTNEFLPAEYIRDSYIYKDNLENTSTSSSSSCDESEKGLKGIGKRLHFFPRKYSKLSKQEHVRCLKGLQLVNLNKDPATATSSECFFINVYTSKKAEILEENKIYQQLAENRWKSLSHSTHFLREGNLINEFKNLWRRKLLNVFDLPQFYHKIDMIGLASPTENENQVEVTHLNNLLELGNLAKFTPPAKIEHFRLNPKTFLNRNEELFNSKLPVSWDENIEDLIKDHLFNIVISSSALKRLVDNTDDNNFWHIPIIVKQHTLKDSNGVDISRKIIYFDKPLPSNLYSPHDYSKLIAKRVIKDETCQIEVLKFSEEQSIENEVEEDIVKKIQKCLPFDRKSKQKSQQDASNSESYVKLRKVLTETKSTSENATTVHHNVSYRLWKFDRKRNFLSKDTNVEKELIVLVRCKLDACNVLENGTLQPVIIQPKLELQLDCGGQVPTKAELSQAWTSLFFRPFSTLCRVRVHNIIRQVVGVENCNLNSINREAMTHYQYKPHLGLAILHRIFNSVSNLQVGNYLLRHEPKFGPFVALLQEIDSEEQSDKFDLYSYYFNSCRIENKVKLPWLPINPNLILLSHLTHNQLPATFRPAFGQVRKNLKKQQKKKQKKRRNAPTDQ